MTRHCQALSPMVRRVSRYTFLLRVKFHVLIFECNFQNCIYYSLYHPNLVLSTMSVRSVLLKNQQNFQSLTVLKRRTSMSCEAMHCSDLTVLTLYIS